SVCSVLYLSLHLLLYSSRSLPTSSWLLKVISSATCFSKHFRAPDAKASYDRCASRRGLIFGIGFQVRFSAMRALRSFFTSVIGSGLSGEKRTVPFLT